MIPLELWNSDEMRPRRLNALAKAVRDKPLVTAQAADDERQFYSVNQYVVEHFTDRDGQQFIECNCAAGLAPIDPATGLPKYEAVPCYHAASVLLFIGEKET